MSASGSSIQKQWDIGQSVFLASAAVIALLSAASQDDVQPQAVLAMEALGAGLLVDQNRIGEGIDALNGGESRKLSRLKLMVGLNNGGVAREMRKSVSCVAAFMLAVACKTCFTDRQAGGLLYDMMIHRSLLRTVPVSRSQIEQFIESISGYGYKIMPSQILDQVAMEVRAVLTHSSDMSGLFCSSNIQELAEILSETFEALRDTKVRKMSLDGHQTGIWLCSVFIWLFPTEVEILLNGHVIHGIPSSRVKVTLNKRDDGSWHLQKWYPQKKVLDLVIGGYDNVPTSQHRALPLSHQPAITAKTSLAAAYRLEDAAIEATGHIASALVDIAFEYGYLRAHETHGLSEVAFKDICQDQFLSSYHTITKTFGWQLDSDSSTKERRNIVAAYEHWMKRVERDQILASGEKSLGSQVQDMRRLLLQIENQFFQDNGYPMISENNLEHMGIIDPVIHIATEALYCSIFEKHPDHRTFRPLTAYSLHSNARILWHLLCGKLSSIENGLQQFRAEAIKSVLPGSVEFSPMDLAVVSNGLVAYLSPLTKISTIKRISLGVSITAGCLRWGDDHSPFNKLQEQDAAEFPSNRSFYENSQRLQVFRDGTYTGLEALSSPEVADVETLISTSGRTLMLTTYLTSPSLQDAPVPVNWWHSMNALAFSEHIRVPHMTALGEEALAQSWEESRIFDTIGWLNIGGNAGSSSITRFITATSSSEAERFFEAGRMFLKRKILVRQSGPLLQCIKVAMDNWDQWAVIA